MYIINCAKLIADGIFNDNIFSFKNTKNIMKISDINPAIYYPFSNSVNRKI